MVVVNEIIEIKTRWQTVAANLSIYSCSYHWNSFNSSSSNQQGLLELHVGRDVRKSCLRGMVAKLNFLMPNLKLDNDFVCYGVRSNKNIKLWVSKFHLGQI